MELSHKACYFPLLRICSELLRWNSPIWLVSWLLYKSTSMNFVKLVKKLGILPSKLLLLRSMDLSSFRNESDDGIWPMKLLDLRKISVTFVRFPSDAGINPAKLQFYEIKKDFQGICITNSKWWWDFTSELVEL